MSVLTKMMGLDDDETHTAESLMGTYYKWMLANKVADFGIGAVSGRNEDERLARKDKILEIAQRKRALGLPYDDADYEEATNNDRPFRTSGAVPAFGKRLSNLVPEPNFLQPKNRLESVLPYAFPVPGANIEASGLESMAAKLKYKLSNEGNYAAFRRVAGLFK